MQNSSNDMALDASVRFDDEQSQIRRGFRLIRAWCAAACSRYRAAVAQQHHRRALGDLSDRSLADIGLTRREAQQQAAKWLWE